MDDRVLKTAFSDRDIPLIGASLEAMRQFPDRFPQKAARRIMEHAWAFEPIQDGRIYIEKINRPMIDEDNATPAEYWVGLRYAVDEKKWLEYHESGTFVRMLQSGKDLFS